MTLQLVMPLEILRGALRTLQQPTASETPVRLALHLSRFQDGTEFLAHSGDASTAEGALLLWPFAQEPALLPQAWAVQRALYPERPLVGLGIGAGAAAGQAVSFVQQGRETVSSALTRLRIVGGGMPSISFSDTGAETLRPLWIAADGLYSRMIGTVGLRTFSRIQKARIAVIGAGGNGSLMAEQLARWMGSQGRLAIVDADRLDAANLPAWAGANGRSVEKLTGRPKAEALAAYLAAAPDAPRLEAVTASCLDWTALAALKQYDFFVCCVDNPAARFAAAFLATLYLRPLLDVASGVFLGQTSAQHQSRVQEEEARSAANIKIDYRQLPYALLEAGSRTMGADVRLTIPGSGETSGGCLLCLGGVGDKANARETLTDSRREKAPTRGGFWQERAGSCGFLNSDAVNQGMRMIIAFYEGHQTQSEHWQMNQSLRTPPQWKLISHAAKPCALCQRAGHGDAGLKDIKIVAQ